MTTERHRISWLTATVIVTAALVLGACSSSGSGGTPAHTGAAPVSGASSGAQSAPTGKADKSPIVLGGMFTNTPFPFGTDAMKTAGEVFKDLNAAGGIAGHPVKYVTGDDGGDPTKGGALGRQLLGQGAVAIVGSASFVDCGTNQEYYIAQKIVSVDAAGSAGCYTTPNIAVVTLSPFTQATAMLYYAYTTLGDRKLCYFQPSTPGSGQAIAQAVKRFETITGSKLLINDQNIPMNETDFAPHLVKAKTAGCDAILYGGSDTVAAATLKSASIQQMKNVDFLYVSVSYTAQLAKAVGSLGMKVYASTGLVPFTGTSPELDAWRAVAAKAGAAQSVFSEAGYIAAQWMITVLKSIKGPITRAAVTAAFKTGTPYRTPLVTAPLTFGPGNSHDRSDGINIVTLKGGAWQTAKMGLNIPSTTGN